MAEVETEAERERCLMRRGEFALDGAAELELARYLRRAEQVTEEGTFPAYPPHGRAVDVRVVLDRDVDAEGCGVSATVLGSDLTHEYVSINADYRS